MGSIIKSSTFHRFQPSIITALNRKRIRTGENTFFPMENWSRQPPSYARRWREVSTSSKSSDLWDRLARIDRLSENCELTNIGVSIDWKQEPVLLCGQGQRERESCGGEAVARGRTKSGWKRNLKGSQVGGVGALKSLLGGSASILRSSFSSLISFTLCNCLNLSCSRAMEE